MRRFSSGSSLPGHLAGAGVGTPPGVPKWGVGLSEVLVDAYINGIVARLQ